MNELPLVSIMIATYNSAWILEKPLKAIQEQSYPHNLIEVLIIDGGSKDNTRLIAERYGCIVLDNPKTDPVSAKLIGMLNAHGKYLMTIDHDEVLANKDSIKNRILAFREHPECKVALLSGYRCPKDYTGLNEYVSEFGDPFSLFYYRFSAGYKYYYKELAKRSSLKYCDNNYSVFRLDKGTRNIILELICLGTLINIEYFRNLIDLKNSKNSITHLLIKMVNNGENSIIMSKNDPLDHYSVDSIKKYLPKLRWRVINNIHYSDRAAQGFSGRQEESGSSNIQKYLFPFYSISIIFPTLDSIFLSLSRMNPAFLWHPFLCVYVTGYIVYQYILKILHRPPILKTYDGNRITS